MTCTPWTRLSILITAALLACAPALAEQIVIPGSGNPEYVLHVLGDAFNASQNKHRVVVPPSVGTAGALREVTEGNAVLGRVGRPLKEAEKVNGMTYLALGRDAVVFVGGAGVSVRNVTPVQMYDAYTGKASDWKALGGKPGPIRAVGREVTDASRSVVDRKYPEFATIQYGEHVKLVHLDPQVIEILDRFPTSLAFLNRSALAAASTAVVPMALDGVEPTIENLTAGKYPLSLELGLVYRSGALTDGAKAFLAFLETPDAARILRAHGVQALPTAFSKAR